MQFLRLWIRALGLFVWTVALFSIRMSFYPLRRFDEARDRRWRRWWFSRWARGFAWIFGVRITLRGQAPVPPFYMVCNHLSYLDVLLMVCQTGCGFVARGDLEHWPVIGFMCKKLDVLFIDRKDKRDAMRVNDLIARTIALGDGMCIFPESRIFTGRDVEPFKSALIEPAIKIDMPIHYATVSYETYPGDPPASTIVGWWRPEPFFFHVARQLKHKGCKATVTFGDAPMRNSNRKELASALREAVRANFTPLAFAREDDD